jgi:hydrogenase expression/formation protein HypC
MCLSIPAKIVSIDGNMAEVSAGGAIFKAGLHLIEDARVGDFILLHAGFAIQKISEKDAAETLRLFADMNDSLNVREV